MFAQNKIVLIDLKGFKKEGKKILKRVEDMTLNGKNIYSNIKGHENEINYELYDLPLRKTGFENLVASLTILHPGKVGREFKMTTGHKHDKEEVYFFIDGDGYILLNKKKFKVKKNCMALVRKNVWHRVVNTGEKKLIFISVFEKYEGRS